MMTGQAAVSLGAALFITPLACFPQSALSCRQQTKHGDTEEADSEFAKVKELAKEALPEPLIKAPRRRSEPAA
jgi:hypothetical protein